MFHQRLVPLLTAIDKSPINICFLIDALEIGGTEKQLIEIMQQIDKNRFRVYLVCLKNSILFENIQLNGKKYLLDVKRLKSIDCLRKIILLRNIFRKEGIHIVQTYFFDANVIGVITAKLAEISWIISCRRDMGFWYDKRNLSYLRVVNKLVDRFLVNSEAVRDNLANREKIPKSKIDIIYNGIDVSHYDRSTITAAATRSALNIPDNHVVVVCIANLNRRVKRIDIFVEAAAIISKTVKDVFFLIVGDGALRAELQNQARNLNVYDKIVFTGTRTDIAKLLNIADIGVLTSDSEGFSNALLEYMAAGIAVVATDVGGNRELIQENNTGFLVPPGNPVKVADTVIKLIQDKDLRVTFGMNGRSIIDNRFSIESMIKNLEQYYSDLIMKSNKR
jgi:L-malate glycosyltransferase